MDDTSAQADEIEVLSSIYGEDWVVDDEASRRYIVNILKRPGNDIKLEVKLPEEYPTSAPPYYQLHAIDLSGQDKQEIENTLNDLYMESMDAPIIYMWVEAIREYVTKLFTTDSPSGDKEALETDQQNTVQSTKQESECPEIFHGEPFSERKSTFQAHVARVTTVQEVKRVITELYKNKRIADATHNMRAYRIELTSGYMAEDCEDDGETNASSRMLYLLKVMEVRNVLVVVSRWFGGVLLGPDRFKFINNVSRNALEKYGFVDKNQQKKGKRSK